MHEACGLPGVHYSEFVIGFVLGELLGGCSWLEKDSAERLVSQDFGRRGNL